MARTTSRAVNMPTAVLPSVRRTSLTTSALILLARINWAAMPTVSFIRTVATRAVFLRRMSPTCLATSLGLAARMLAVSQCWYTLCQLSIQNLIHTAGAKAAKEAVILTLCSALGDGDRSRATSEHATETLQVYQKLEICAPKENAPIPRG